MLCMAWVGTGGYGIGFVSVVTVAGVTDVGLWVVALHALAALVALLV